MVFKFLCQFCCLSLIHSFAWASNNIEPPTAGGKNIECPKTNFFNIRLQEKTELSIDDPPSGWTIISTQNPNAKQDSWSPTIAVGARLEVRGSDVILQCEYKPRNWVQNWVLGAAVIEKNMGPHRQGQLCWTFEGAEGKPVHRQLTKEDPIFLPCVGGVCKLLCS